MTGDSITLAVNHKPVTVRIAGEVFIPYPLPTVWASWQTLESSAARLAANQYEMALKPGTNVQSYTYALQQALRPGIVVGTEGASSFAGSWTHPCSSG